MPDSRPQDPDNPTTLKENPEPSPVPSGSPASPDAPPPFAGGPGRAVGRWAWRLIVIAAFAWCIGYLPLQLFGERGLTQYRRLKREVAELHQRNLKLAEGIRLMRLEVQRLRDDDATLEKAAREDLGMVREGELIFVVED